MRLVGHWGLRLPGVLRELLDSGVLRLNGVLKLSGVLRLGGVLYLRLSVRELGRPGVLRHLWLTLLQSIGLRLSKRRLLSKVLLLLSKALEFGQILRMRRLSELLREGGVDSWLLLRVLEV